MKTNLRNQIVISSLLIIAACGGGGGGSKSNKGQELERLGQVLSPETNAHFENWKKSLIKTCDLESVFGLKEDESSIFEKAPSNLDVKMLLSQNKNSAIFTDGTNVIGLSGFAISSGLRTGRIVHNDSDVEVRKFGSTCTVKIGDKTVFETVLAKDITINLELKKAKVEGYSFEEKVQKILRPTQRSVEVLGQMLGLNSEDARKFIKYNERPASFILRPQSAKAWYPSVYNVIDSGVTVDVLVALPDIVDLAGGQFTTLNTADRGSLGLALKSELGQAKLGEYKGVKPYDYQEAVKCLNERVRGDYKYFFSVCEFFDLNVHKKAEDSGLKLSLILKNIEENMGVNDDWKAALWAFVNLAKNQQKPLSSLGSTPSMERIAHNDAIVVEFFRTHDFRKAADAKVRLERFSFDISLAQPGLSSEIITDLLNITPDFFEYQDSYLSMLNHLLGNSPDRGLETLRFINSIPDILAYKEKIDLYRSIEVSNYQVKVEFMRTIFQRKVSLEDLDKAIEDLRRARR